mmetsp:Transcript_8988/g.23533  ORF Transcript_8988/g.23533 Transcript_8988/m.23533 type:complete len:514 (-) Transcript_8988:38-1579(-)
MSDGGEKTRGETSDGWDFGLDDDAGGDSARDAVSGPKSTARAPAETGPGAPAAESEEEEIDRIMQQFDRMIGGASAEVTPSEPAKTGATGLASAAQNSSQCDNTVRNEGARSSSEQTVARTTPQAAESSEGLQMLKSVFENKGDQELLAALEAHNGHVERAAEYLLASASKEATSGSHVSASQPRVLDVAGQSQTTVETEDEETQDALRRIAQMEEDERIAAQLQRELVMQAQPRRETSHREPQPGAARAPHRGGRESGPDLLDVCPSREFVQAEANRLLDVYSSVTQDELMRGVRLCDVTNTSKHLGSSFIYEIHDIELSTFRVTSNDAERRLMRRDAVVVVMRSIDIVFKIGSWSYRNDFQPRLGDQGSATAHLDGVSLTMTFVPRRFEEDQNGANAAHEEQASGAPGTSGTIFWVVVGCDVALTEVRVRFEDSKVGWVYNALSSFFVTSLEEAGQNALRGFLSETVAPRVELEINGTRNFRGRRHPEAVLPDSRHRQRQQTGTIDDPIDI